MYMENNGVHIVSAIERTTCAKHDVPQGVPCWSIPKNIKDDLGYYAAICGDRIERAGYVGKIAPASMRSKSPDRVESNKLSPRRSTNSKSSNNK